MLKVAHQRGQRRLLPSLAERGRERERERPRMRGGGCECEGKAQLKECVKERSKGWERSRGKLFGGLFRRAWLSRVASASRPTDDTLKPPPPPPLPPPPAPMPLPWALLLLLVCVLAAPVDGTLLDRLAPPPDCCCCTWSRNRCTTDPDPCPCPIPGPGRDGPLPAPGPGPYMAKVWALGASEGGRLLPPEPPRGGRGTA